MLTCCRVRADALDQSVKLQGLATCMPLHLMYWMSLRTARSSCPGSVYAEVSVAKHSMATAAESSLIFIGLTNDKRVYTSDRFKSSSLSSHLLLHS